jgi:hypothetical protein
MFEHLLSIFCLVDDFCKIFHVKFSKKGIGNHKVKKNMPIYNKISLSEIINKGKPQLCWGSHS